MSGTLEEQPSRLRTLAGVITKGPRLRTRAFIPFALLLLWLATQGPLSYWGVVIAMVGELLRLWASGHLHKGGGTVTTSGPYAFCRNPLYLGSLLMGVGSTLAVRSYWLTGGITIIFIIFHLITIAYEESRLAIRYGEPFKEYCAHVPRLLPRPWPWHGAQRDRFNWGLLKANRELGRALALLVFIGLLVALSLVGWPGR